MRVVPFAAAAIAVTCALTGCAASKPTDFGKETEATFVRACAHPATGRALPEDVCRCAYGRITASMSFEEYQQLDKALREDPDTVPDEVADAFAACSGESTSSSTSSSASTSTTTPATTTTRRP